MHAELSKQPSPLQTHKTFVQSVWSAISPSLPVVDKSGYLSKLCFNTQWLSFRVPDGHPDYAQQCLFDKNLQTLFSEDYPLDVKEAVLHALVTKPSQESLQIWMKHFNTLYQDHGHSNFVNDLYTLSRDPRTMKDLIILEEQSSKMTSDELHRLLEHHQIDRPASAESAGPMRDMDESPRGPSF